MESYFLTMVEENFEIQSYQMPLIDWKRYKISLPWLKKILNSVLSNAPNWLKMESDFFTMVEDIFEILSLTKCFNLDSKR